jgi:RND family efflux transporter MFP subunit
MERTGVAQRAITILSPQTGTVVEKQAVAGLAVTPMMHLYVVADLSAVWVVADVYERDLAQVKVGQTSRMKIDALPGRTFEGVVTFVSPTVDQATRTVKVRFEFPNRDGTLRPGMYATVEIAATGGEGLVVPSDSVVDTGERKIVFVARGAGRFDPRPITTGAAFNGRYEVLEGLRDGEVIATSGQFLLDSESRIRGARTGGAPKHGAH